MRQYWDTHLPDCFDNTRGSKRTAGLARTTTPRAGGEKSEASGTWLAVNYTPLGNYSSGLPAVAELNSGCDG